MSKNCPASVTNFKINLLAVSIFFVSVFLMRQFSPGAGFYLKAFVSLGSVLLPILLYDLFVVKVYKNPSAQLSARNEPDFPRVGIKIIGLFATYALIAFAYWVFPEYRGAFYAKYWTLLSIMVPVALLLSFYYFIEVDVRMEKPEDAYWHMGMLVLGNTKVVSKTVLAEHARGWIVKAFFFPLMFLYLYGNVENIIWTDFTKMHSFINVYDYLYTFLFTIDVIFAAVGYMMTFRFLDSHIRSVEPTMMGWVVAIMCYSPFWTSVFYNSYFKYDDNFYWGDMTSGLPLLQWVWGITIILLVIIYSFATVAMGYRFSNLTYRGLITNGPYRFSKHPAYVSKNIMWWMISVPFFPSESWDMMIVHCVGLAGVNMIYYWRARTEENHLSNYPEYVEYANWMNENGILRFMGDMFPYLKYSEARCKSYNSVVWWKKLGRKPI
ncbi:MAG: isoprenylcysteine carboxyl methyltransferase [Proteobacteria bacterium]|nr:isoprenylcysteine carboxyl methyltransferase [Pseudomonadota bacterium]